MTDTLYPLFPEGFIDDRPLSNSYEIKMPNPFSRTEVEQGPGVQERNFRNAPATVTVAWPMTGLQFEIFDGWLAETGSAYTWHSARVMRGATYETMAVQFVAGTYDAKRSGNGWVVQGQLETKSYRSTTGTALAVTMLTYGSDQTAMELDTLLSGAWSNIVEGCRGAP